MSEGPIKREREAWEPKRVTTNPNQAIHAASGATIARAYCGRKSEHLTQDDAEVTCSDCLAAIRADGSEGLTP